MIIYYSLLRQFGIPLEIPSGGLHIVPCMYTVESERERGVGERGREREREMEASVGHVSDTCVGYLSSF